MGKKKTGRWLLLGGMALIAVFYMVYASYYRRIMENAGVKDDGENYAYHFKMIVDDPNSTFWQDVFESAQKEAKESDVLLEMEGTGWETEYDKNDFMNISIAAQVDGIIVEYNGEYGLEEKINEAVEQGIPVVTVMSDAPHSERKSFVGISDYQMGIAYGEQVAKYVDENTKNIFILMKRNLDDMNQSKIYTQITNAVKAKAGSPEQVQVVGQNMLSAGTFEVEELIRDIFQQKDNPPDILVCMDEETTECACQTMLDFNMVGEVKIVGYYISDDIMDALKKNLLPVTCRVDTQRLGKNSVEALTEYLREGRVSSYYNVDMNFVTAESAGKTGRSVAADEKDALEKSVAGQ